MLTKQTEMLTKLTSINIDQTIVDTLICKIKRGSRSEPDWVNENITAD